jgi:hypothetical protein
VTLDAPLLLIIADSDSVWPTVTVPNVRAAGFDPRTPAGGCELFALTPWHPVNRAKAVKITKAPQSWGRCFFENSLAVFDMVFRGAASANTVRDQRKYGCIHISFSHNRVCG